MRHDSSWNREKREEYNIAQPALRSKRRHDVDVRAARRLAHLRTMLSECTTKFQLVIGERLDRQRWREENRARIESITMESGRTFAARMFIDATYEGDLMAAAGVVVSCWPRGERGVRRNTQRRRAEAERQESPVCEAGRSVREAGRCQLGIACRAFSRRRCRPRAAAIELVQAYCYRLCTTDVAENRRDWPKPADYDESRYELLLRNFEAGDERAPWHPLWMPNRKTDTNNNGAFSTDYIGGNYDYPNADYATRDKIVADHRSRISRGLLWTLANNPRVPEKVRAEFKRLGSGEG